MNIQDDQDNSILSILSIHVNSYTVGWRRHTKDKLKGSDLLASLSFGNPNDPAHPFRFHYTGANLILPPLSNWHAPNETPLS
jgi:hypothetical protein